ncbi:MAG: transporter related [Dehalococcoidia bacterium]|nr:transporter related [Dehalococcoidia bacterium]
MKAISIEGVSKRFVIKHEHPRSFQELLISLVKRRNGHLEELWALRDVSFDVEQGETFGLIGANGSGKSTILKLMTRVMEPTAGRIQVDGKVSALIELGAGFHPDLTGRENIFLLGSILGFTSREMKERYQSIVAYSDLERFIDTPVKHYSSGMYMRLGFAVAVCVDPDVLIVDEVLAVGDISFQEKCLNTFYDFQRMGKTILMVSHDLDIMSKFCKRALYIEQGQVKAIGQVDEVVESYLTSVHAR